MHAHTVCIPLLCINSVLQTRLASRRAVRQSRSRKIKPVPFWVDRPGKFLNFAQLMRRFSLKMLRNRCLAQSRSRPLSNAKNAGPVRFMTWRITEDFDVGRGEIRQISVCNRMQKGLSMERNGCLRGIKNLSKQPYIRTRAYGDVPWYRTSSAVRCFLIAVRFKTLDFFLSGNKLD